MFLQTFSSPTRIGSATVHGMWSVLRFALVSILRLYHSPLVSLIYFKLRCLNAPSSCPLRDAHSLFWSIRINDEGVGSPNGFHALVNAGSIDIISPARVESFGGDGKSSILSNGTHLCSDAVILALT